MRILFLLYGIILLFDCYTAEVTRLKQQLQELYKLTLDQIESQPEDLKNRNVDGILEELINTNSTGLLRSYPSTCPQWNGIYTIEVPGLEPFPALCDSSLAGPGWTVVANRFEGIVNFYQNWTVYKEGFGDFTGEFFIGLKKLHAITASREHELYIYLEDFNGQKRYAHYDNFAISSENEFYALQKLGTYSGDAGDSLTYHLNMKFSTYDSDHSNTTEKCPITRMGAWWYNACTFSNLFGMYLKGKYDDAFGMRGICWYGWQGKQYSYKTMQMLVRPKCACS